MKALESTVAVLETDLQKCCVSRESDVKNKAGNDQVEDHSDEVIEVCDNYKGDDTSDDSDPSEELSFNKRD